MEDMELAEGRDVVETRIGARVSDHHQAVTHQNSTAIGHGPLFGCRVLYWWQPTRRNHSRLRLLLRLLLLLRLRHDDRDVKLLARPARARAAHRRRTEIIEPHRN